MSRQWKPSFCSLDPQIDEEHQALFRLLDRLGTHRRESDIEDLNLLLDQLIEYTFSHFAREEAAMKARGYPRLAAHAEQHQVMRRALIEALRQVAKGSLEIPIFIQHIKDSFGYHFETDDMTFVTWQQQRQAKTSSSGRHAPVSRNPIPGDALKRP